MQRSSSPSIRRQPIRRQLNVREKLLPTIGSIKPFRSLNRLSNRRRLSWGRLNRRSQLENLSSGQLIEIIAGVIKNELVFKRLDIFTDHFGFDRPRVALA